MIRTAQLRKALDDAPAWYRLWCAILTTMPMLSWSEGEALPVPEWALAIVAPWRTLHPVAGAVITHASWRCTNAPPPLPAIPPSLRNFYHWALPHVLRSAGV